MLKEINQLPSFNFSTVINKFEELSGWEALLQGEYNGIFTSPISFVLDYEDGGDIYQREQDFVFIFYPNTDEQCSTLGMLRDVSHATTYKNHVVTHVGLGCICQFLVHHNELPNRALIITT